MTYIQLQNRKKKCVRYVPEIPISHKRHVDLDLFNICSNHTYIV